MIFLMVFRYQIPSMYINDQIVIDKVADIMPVFACLLMFDSFQGVMVGVIKGCGYQKYGIYIAALSYWIVMLPACYICAFTYDLELKGIWIGIVIGIAATSFCYLIFILQIDWVKLAGKIINRIQKDKAQVDGL
jgi:MATE family multidrug resistance protein